MDMITNAEVVSRVANGLRAINKDNAIRGRYVLNIARTKAKFLIAQKMDELTLFKEESLKTSIPCFPMKRIKSKECAVVEFRVCNKIMRSCKPLPELIFSKNGPAIFRVSNIDESTTYDPITKRAYTRLKKRKYQDPDARYYSVDPDGHLLALESSAELLEVDALAIDIDEAKALSECEASTVKCKNAWETNFVCPDRFLDIVIKDTISEVANFYRTSVSDENPDMDEHQKTKTTN